MKFKIYSLFTATSLIYLLRYLKIFSSFTNTKCPNAKGEKTKDWRKERERENIYG